MSAGDDFSFTDEAGDQLSARRVGDSIFVGITPLGANNVEVAVSKLGLVDFISYLSDTLIEIRKEDSEES